LRGAAGGAPHAPTRADGLTVQAADATLHARPRATDDPHELGPQDAVFVTVKAPALPAVAAGIAPLLGPETPVVFVMNGIPWWYFHAHGGPLEGTRLSAIDPGDAVWRAVGPERAIGGVVY
jgi:2-dehydropantoate 2-reductase